MGGLGHIRGMVVIVVRNRFHVVVFQGHQEVYKRLAGDAEFSHDITILAKCGLCFVFNILS